MATAIANERWASYRDRFRSGSWRAPIFRDMVLADIRAVGPDVTVLDIGCGHGFDGDARLQQSLAEASSRYLGVEPDAAIEVGDCFAEVHRSFLEDATIAPGSVHVALAVMVLEHVATPERFWDKLRAVLAPGGVFWGFTMDGRHRFCRASRFAERLRLKDLYLRWLRGERGRDRYENYPVHYRCNTPEQVKAQAHGFASCECLTLGRVGQLDYYLPRALRPIASGLDRWDLWLDRPGSILAIRAMMPEE
jgi:SAM-dependent methyltransferase